MDAAVEPNVQHIKQLFVHHHSMLLLCVVCTLQGTLIFLSHFKIGLLGGYVVVAGALKPILRLILHRIAALNLASLLFKPGNSFSLFLFSMAFITIVHPSTLIITLNSIQFWLLEVIVCPCVHLSQPSTVINILSLLTLYSYRTLYSYPSSVIRTLNLSPISCFTIYVSINIIVSCHCV